MALKQKISGLTDQQQLEFNNQIEAFFKQVRDATTKKGEGKPYEIPKLELEITGLTIPQNRKLKKVKEELQTEAVRLIKGIDETIGRPDR